MQVNKISSQNFNGWRSDAATKLFSSINVNSKKGRKCLEVFSRINNNSQNHTVAFFPDMFSKIIAYPNKGTNAKKIIVEENFFNSSKLSLLETMFKALSKENHRLSKLK